MALEGLKTYDDEWDSIETPEKKEYDPIPDGRYQAKIDKVYLDVAKNTGADLLCWELVIIAGKFKNRRLFKKNTLLTRENIRWLKDDLEKIELKISPISTLDEHLNDFLNIAVEIYVKNKEYQGKNYATPYINKRLNIEIPPDLNTDMNGEADVDGAGRGDVDGCPF